MEENAERDPEVVRSKPHRLFRSVLILAVVVAVYALTGFFIVPRVVRWAVQTKGSEALHRSVTLSEVAFNPFTLEANLRGLRILDRDRQPLFSFDRLHLRIGPSGIFRRAWRLRDLTIDKPALQVRFLPDGKLSVADLLTSDEKKSSTPRVIIDQLSIRGGKIDYADESAKPRFATSFSPLNADVRDLITIPGEHGEHALSIGFDRNSTIRIAGEQTLEPLGFSGHIEIKRVALATLVEKFAPDAPLQLRSGEADLALLYDVRKQPNGVQLRVNRGQLTATDLALASRATGAELLAIPKIDIGDASVAFPARSVAIAYVRILDPRGVIAWDPKGQFNWSSGSRGQSKNDQKTAGGAPWKVHVEDAAIERGTLHYEDRQPAVPVVVDLTDLTLSASGITENMSVPIGFMLHSAAGAGHLALDGSVVPSPFTLDTKMMLASIDILPFRGYAAVPAMTFGAGKASFDGRLLIAPAQPYLIEGSGAVNGLELLDAANNRVLGCTMSTIRQMRLDGSTSRFRIRGLDLDGLYANVAIDKQRNLNLSAIGKSSDVTPGPPKSQKGSFDIGTINVKNGTIDYRDDSLVLPFSTAITSTTGKITDFSTTSAAGATVHLDGNVAEHGSMKAVGTMRMADPFAGTDLQVHFRSVPMPTLTPYSAEFAGYSIDRGLLDLDLHYRIANRRLVGDHQIVASDLTLGKKVGGTKAGFAVRLAVALLKDHDGRINLQVPIEGTIDSPEFNYRVVFWQAVKTILGNLVKAPFRALGHAMGIGGEDLQTVSFDPGESTVIPPMADKLKKIAGELAARGELMLDVAGRFDPQLDAAALKKAKLEALIAARRDVPKAGSAEPPPLETILEELYTTAFSAERLAAERAKFTSTPPPPPPPPPKKFWQRKQPAPAAPPPVLEAKDFYEALRAELVNAQTVTADDLRSLAHARAQAIAAVMTSGGVLPDDRVRVIDPAPATAKAGSQQINIEMKLSAKGATPDETND